MNDPLSMPAWTVVSVAVLVVALVVVLLARIVAEGRERRALATSVQLEAAARRELEQRLAALERRASRPAAAEQEFVITQMGESSELDAVDTPAPTVPAPLFADLVLRESVVQVASLAHGVRRALSPEVRHRIRFEMRRELKRARKRRRSEDRIARREWEARQRATVTTTS